MQCPNCTRPTVSRLYVPNLQKERAVCSSCGWTGPRCFGMKWEAAEVKCRGGNDPNYYDEGTNSHKRPPCSWYKSCAQETTRNRQQGTMHLPVATQVQPPAQQPFRQVQPMPGMLPGAMPQMMPQVPHKPLVIPPPHVPAQAPTATSPIQAAVMAGLNTAGQPRVVIPPAWQKPGQPAQPQQPQQQFYWGQTQQPMTPMQFVPPDQAMTPALVPQNHVAPGQQVASFLTVPEPAPPDQSWLRMAGWSAFRGGAKGVLLSLANVIDHVPIGPLIRKT